MPLSPNWGKKAPFCGNVCFKKFTIANFTCLYYFIVLQKFRKIFRADSENKL